MKRILVIHRQSPYGGQLARSALDAALAAAVFEQDISLLFMDEGVWQLAAAGSREDAGDIEKTVRSLAMYDLDQLFFDLASVQERGMNPDHLAAPCQPVDNIAEFIDSYDVIWSF